MRKRKETKEKEKKENNINALMVTHQKKHNLFPHTSWTIYNFSNFDKAKNSIGMCIKLIKP